MENVSVTDQEQSTAEANEAQAMSTPAIYESLSVVVPFYHEEGNILPLIEEIHIGLSSYEGSWEIIAVDDGSGDGTADELKAARQQFGDHVNILCFSRNFGQTAAMQAGIDAARGDLIVTMDGDRQNDPADILTLIKHLKENDKDMVSGWRKNRQDHGIKRKLPSKLANWMIRKATGVTLKDYGCSLKVYRASIIKKVRLIGEMHRFIPAWVACVTDPRRISDIAVNHRAREVGVSKYGISRTTRVILDLLVVVFYMRFSRRPGHFFGSIGLAGVVFGGVILTYLLGLKLFLGADIGGRPLLFTGILFLITGVQLVTTGVLAEMLTRNSSDTSYPTRYDTLSKDSVWK